MRRDTLEKETRPIEGIADYVKSLLDEIQKTCLTRQNHSATLIFMNAMTMQNLKKR